MKKKDIITLVSNEVPGILILIVGLVCAYRYVMFGLGYLDEEQLVPLDRWALFALVQYGIYRSFARISSAFRGFTPALAQFLITMTHTLKFLTFILETFNSKKKDETI